MGFFKLSCCKTRHWILTQPERLLALNKQVMAALRGSPAPPLLASAESQGQTLGTTRPLLAVALGKGLPGKMVELKQLSSVPPTSLPSPHPPVQGLRICPWSPDKRAATS